MQARSEFDQGAADLAFKMSYMTLLTVPSAEQKRALNKLLADQQNPHSASYHKWLTPEQYADRFGLSANDLKNLVDWLQSQGFTIVRTARARNWIAFSGTVDQVEKTFQTQIRNYQVDGEMHFANTVPPAIPAVLTGLVSGIRGLNNFHLKSQAHRAQPDYTLTVGNNSFLFAAPGDIAAIYDINTLYTNGIDGSGETLAVIGQTGIFQSGSQCPDQICHSHRPKRQRCL
jgi:subtilase family serine protease